MTLELRWYNWDGGIGMVQSGRRDRDGGIGMVDSGD